MGDVDELNSNIGVLLCEAMPPGVRELLVEIGENVKVRVLRAGVADVSSKGEPMNAEAPAAKPSKKK